MVKYENCVGDCFDSLLPTPLVGCNRTCNRRRGNILGEENFCCSLKSVKGKHSQDSKVSTSLYVKIVFFFSPRIKNQQLCGKTGRGESLMHLFDPRPTGNALNRLGYILVPISPRANPPYCLFLKIGYNVATCCCRCHERSFGVSEGHTTYFPTALL